MLRRMCGVTCKDKIRNEHIQGTTKVAEVFEQITDRRMNWYGHVMRRDEEHILREESSIAIAGKRKMGYPWELHR